MNIERGGKIGEEALVIGDEVGLACEECGHVALCDVMKEWDEFVSHAIAAESWIGVRFIDRDCDSTKSTQFVGFGTPQREEWFLGRAAHAGDAVDSRSAHQVEKHRFRLVIGGVTGEDVRWKRCEACRAGPGLEVGSIVESNAVSDETRTDTIADLSNQVGFGRRARSQAVVDVVRGRCQPGGSRKDEQRHRIGATRHRTGDGTSDGKVGPGKKVADVISLANAERHLALAAPRVARRADLLHVAGNDSDECSAGCDGEDDTDPPVPRVCSDRGFTLAIRARR